MMFYVLYTLLHLSPQKTRSWRFTSSVIQVYRACQINASQEMEKNWPTALLLAATGSARLVFSFPPFPDRRFSDEPGMGGWIPTIIHSITLYQIDIPSHSQKSLAFIFHMCTAWPLQWGGVTLVHGQGHSSASADLSINMIDINYLKLK